MSETTEPGRPSDFVRDLGDAVRKNPLSAALIGMGALWLFTSRSGPISAAAQDAWQGTTTAWRSGGRNVKDGARATVDSLRDRGAQAADQLSGVGTRLGNSTSEYVDVIPDMTGNLFDDVRANLGELFRGQPLALGAVGLAVGAAVAASLPSTQTEAAYLGARSDYVKQKAGEIAGDQAQRAVEIGKKVVDAVADEARQQGLTAEGVAANARDLSGKVSRAADAAKKTTSQN
jgi:hypothetical protein